MGMAGNMPSLQLGPRYCMYSMYNLYRMDIQNVLTALTACSVQVGGRSEFPETLKTGAPSGHEAEDDEDDDEGGGLRDFNSDHSGHNDSALAAAAVGWSWRGWRQRLAGGWLRVVLWPREPVYMAFW